MRQSGPNTRRRNQIETTRHAKGRNPQESRGKNRISRRREPTLIHPSPNPLDIPYRRQNADQNPNKNPQEEGTREHLFHPLPKIRSKKGKSTQDSRERWQRKPKRGALIPATTQPMRGGRRPSQEPRGTPDKNFGFYCWPGTTATTSFNLSSPFPLFVDGIQMGRKNSTHIARLHPPTTSTSTDRSAHMESRLPD